MGHPAFEMLPGYPLQAGVTQHGRYRWQQQHAAHRHHGALGEPQHLPLELRRLVSDLINRKAFPRKAGGPQDFGQQLGPGFGGVQVEGILEVPVEQDGGQGIRSPLQQLWLTAAAGAEW
ncbi:MAG: hypothetical protein AAF358_15750 [Pseudomonadota bacterium]